MLQKTYVCDCVIRALPFIIWVLSYGATTLSPKLLRYLSFAFPLLPQDPSVQLKEDFNNSTGATLPGYSGPQTSEWYLWKQLLLFPYRYVHHCFRTAQHIVQENSGGAKHRLPLCVRLVTSAFVHPNRTTLLNSTCNYLYAMTVGKPVMGRWREGLTDTTGALLGTAIGNWLFVWWAGTLTTNGGVLPGVQQYLSQRPLLARGLTLALTFLIPILHGLSAFAGRVVPGTHPMRSVTIRMAGLTDAPEEEDDRPAEIPSPLSTPSPAPMYGWFCGGEGLGYALSGFRFLYRREKVQIPGVIWGFFFDAINTFRNHVEFAAARAAAGKGATGRPLHPLEDGFHRLADGSPDRIFTAASSLPLQLTNLLSFVGGMIVAQGFRTAQDVAPLAYKVPLLSSVLLAAFPPPPLPVEVPNDLYLSARPEKQFVRIFRDYRVASSSEEATSWETTSDEGERDDDSAEVRHRPLHDLLPHVDYEDIPVPFECYCPITRAFMTEPVCTCDGFTYDREAIEEWLHRRRLTSPMTNLPLANDSLRPNLAVRAMLCEVVQQYHALHQKWDQEERV